jgi:hypothetical protein
MERLEQDLKIPFYKENKIWPFVHSVMPLALFFTSRNIVLSLLLIYVFETMEKTVSFFTPYFKENAADSLIGDPVNGALAIFAGWLVTQGTNSNERFLHEVGFWRRWGCFLVIGAVGSIIAIITCPEGFESRDRQRITIGVALIIVVYVGIVLLFYLPYLEDTQISFDITLWLIGASFIALCAEPQLKAISCYMQVIIADVILVVAAFIMFLILELN